MAFENSFRVLKRQSKAASNVEGESLASALELKASRMRRGHNFPWSMPMKMAERFFSIGYELLANYGRSASRPVFFMVASTVGFAALTWAWEGGGLSGPRAPFWTTENHALVAQTPFDADFIEALSFSTARVFPFGPWAEAKAPDDEPRAEAKGTAVERERCSFAARHLAVDHCRPDGVSLHTATEVEGHRLAVRAVAVLQSLFAIVLAFLFGLAVRRRFQIS
jgi:hypothetical protein